MAVAACGRLYLTEYMGVFRSRSAALQTWKECSSICYSRLSFGRLINAEFALAICLLQQPLTFAFDLLFRSLAAASASKENKIAAGWVEQMGQQHLRTALICN